MTPYSEKEEGTGRLPKRLLTPQEKVQDFQRRLREVIGKPCEGEPHARFDEGMVETLGLKPSRAPLFYSTNF